MSRRDIDEGELHTWANIPKCNGTEDNLADCVMHYPGISCPVHVGIECFTGKGHDYPPQPVIYKNEDFPCSKQNSLAKITGGSFSSQDSAPWIARIRSRPNQRLFTVLLSKHICGAVILRNFIFFQIYWVEKRAVEIKRKGI